MVNACQWEFATVGYPKFGIGNTGLCNTTALDNIPNNPQNVNAVSNNNLVTISWQASNNGSKASYFKIEKSTDNAKTFSSVNDNVAASIFSYDDPNVINGTTYIYRVSAGNGVGLSKGANSNAVIPVSTNVSVVPGAPQNITAVAGNGTVTVSWTAPITGDTVGFYNVDKSINGGSYQPVQSKISPSSTQLIDNKAQNGASHLYRVIAGNARGLGVEALSTVVTPRATPTPPVISKLISQLPTTYNSFGQQMVYSPDGNTIVIGEPLGDITIGTNEGNIQIFTKSNGSWTQTNLFTAQVPAIGTNFGWTVDISRDGSTLAIGGLITKEVEIYTKSGTNWMYLQTLVSSEARPGQFGISIAFHPNSSLLAVADHTANPNGISSAGSVQLFTKSNGQWTFSKLLTALTPTANNLFGTLVKFSPDGSTLAISESGGDTTNIPDVGTVNLLTQSAGNWTVKQILVSNSPATGFNFGGSGYGGEVNFSPDSNSLAIGEQLANSVLIFSRTNNSWNQSQILKIPNAIGGFGASVSFSASGNLAIGEPGGTSTGGISGAGNVYLYNPAGTNWLLNRTLSAQVPTLDNGFGETVLFNPINNELAVFEKFGDSGATANVGVVTIIDLSQLPQ